VWLTFDACGFFLHDLLGWTLARRVRFPEMTLLFVLFGAGVVLGEACRRDFSRCPFAVRALVNVAFLAGAWLVVRWIVPV
jgi:hypothetical protein